MSSDKQQKRVTSYVKKDGTRVRSHTRSAQWERARKAGAAAGFAGVSATAIFVEFGFTLVTTLCAVGIAALTTITVIANEYALRQKEILREQETRAKQQQARKRQQQRTRTTTGKTGARTSSSRTRTTGNRTRSSSSTRRTSSTSRKRK